MTAILKPPLVVQEVHNKESTQQNDACAFMILLLSDVYSRKKAYFPQNSDRFRKMLFNPFLRAEPNDFSFPSFQQAGSARTAKKKKEIGL